MKKSIRKSFAALAAVMLLSVLFCFYADAVSCDCGGYTEWKYVASLDRLECPVCMTKVKTDNFTGFVKEKESGLLMRFNKGEKCTGWTAYIDDSYYFGSNGVAVTGQHTIDGKSYTFDNEGRLIKGSFVDETIVVDGEPRVITRYYGAGGIYAIRWTEIDGEIYYFSKPYDYSDLPDDGAMYRGGTFTVRTAGKNSLRKFTFAVDGRLIGGCWEDEKELDGTYIGTRYYWGPEYVTGERVIDGVTYNFDDQGFVIRRPVADVKITVDTSVPGAAEPGIVVTDGESTLINGTNYILAYEKGNNNCTGIVKITGVIRRGYTGIKRTEFLIGHKKLTDKAAVKPTCTTVGYTAGKYCSDCKKWVSGHEVIPALSHSFKNATCTEAKTCSRCGKAEGKALGHKEQIIAGYAATYKASGLSDGKRCTVCGKITKEREAIKIKSLSKVKNLKVKSVTTSTVKLSFSKVTGAEKYKVYYSTNGKSWKAVTASKTTVTVKNLKAGTSYSFKVRAVAGENEGSASAVVKTATKVAKVSLSSVKSSKAKQIAVSWKTVTGASGYVVEYSTSKKFTSKTTRKATVKKGSSKKTTLNSLKSKKKYYVRVRAYKTVNGKAVYGSYSSVKSVTVK